MHSSGCICFPWIMRNPSGRCLCRQLWQERMYLVLGVCMSVSISGVWKAGKYLSVFVTCLFELVSVCVLCLCVALSLRFCVNVSDRCVGSGLQSCWRCGHAPPSPVGRSYLLHSRSAGKAPSRGYLFCGGVYKPGPLSAQACRCETRSAWHSIDPQNSLQTSGKCLPPCLENGSESDHTNFSRCFLFLTLNSGAGRKLTLHSIRLIALGR